MMLSLSRAAPLLCMFFTLPTFAGDGSSTRIGGGTIYFTGQIVESPCETAPDLRHQQMEMRCHRDGVVSVENVSLAALAGAGVHSSGASMNIRYLDPQRKLAILTVRYD